MIDQKHIELFKGELKEILDDEILNGNKIVETSIGGFSKVSDTHIFIWLEKPFLTPIREDSEHIKYNELNDPHYWKADYIDSKNEQTLACKFG